MATFLFCIRRRDEYFSQVEFDQLQKEKFSFLPLILLLISVLSRHWQRLKLERHNLWQRCRQTPKLKSKWQKLFVTRKIDNHSLGKTNVFIIVCLSRNRKITSAWIWLVDENTELVEIEQILIKTTSNSSIDQQETMRTISTADRHEESTLPKMISFSDEYVRTQSGLDESIQCFSLFPRITLEISTERKNMETASCLGQMDESIREHFSVIVATDSVHFTSRTIWSFMWVNIRSTNNLSLWGFFSFQGSLL